MKCRREVRKETRSRLIRRRCPTGRGSTVITIRTWSLTKSPTREVCKLRSCPGQNSAPSGTDIFPNLLRTQVKPGLENQTTEVQKMNSPLKHFSLSDNGKSDFEGFFLRITILSRGVTLTPKL